MLGTICNFTPTTNQFPTIMKSYLIPLIGLLLVANDSLTQELARVRQNDLWGYIDRTGKQVVEPQFEKCGDFSNGMAAVRKDDKWGYIDATGAWAIQPTFDRVKEFNSDRALVQKPDDSWGYIDKTGQDITTPVPDKYYNYNDGVALFKKNELVGLMDVNGKMIIEPTYSAIKNFHEGQARIEQNDKWGMIDKNGKVTIKPEYDRISRYNTIGMHGTKGETDGMIVNGEFKPLQGVDKIWDFHPWSDLTYARKNDKWGYLNATGEWVIEPQFVKTRTFNEGLAPVYNGDDWGYVDRTGKMVIDYQFDDAEYFSDNGLAPVKVKKLWGFINKQGEMVIPAEYVISVGITFDPSDYMAPKGFHKGSARVRKGKEWGISTRKASRSEESGTRMQKSSPNDRLERGE